MLDNTHENDDLSQLIALWVALENNAPISEEIRIWLYAALKDLVNGVSNSLDDALGFPAKRGKTKVGTKIRKEIRDRKLMSLMAELFEVTREPWTSAGMLEKEVSRVENTVWPRVQKNPCFMRELGDRERMIIDLLNSNSRLPKSTLFFYSLFRERSLFPKVETVDNVFRPNKEASKCLLKQLVES